MRLFIVNVIQIEILVVKTLDSINLFREAGALIVVIIFVLFESQAIDRKYALL